MFWWAIPTFLQPTVVQNLTEHETTGVGNVAVRFVWPVVGRVDTNNKVERVWVCLEVYPVQKVVANA